MDLFEKFKQKRLADEDKRLNEYNKKEEVKRINLEEQKRKNAELDQRRQHLSAQYNDIVIRVLRHIQDAVYPSYEVQANYSIPKWSIGNYVTSYGSWETSSTDWQTHVSVEIQVEKSPNMFTCTTTEGKKNCSLTENDLKNTLLQLHKKKLKGI